MKNEVAKMKETVPIESLNANAPYEAITALTQFPRALDIADNYEQYRITKLEYKFTPSYDTFISQYQPGTSNASMSVPYLYAKRLTREAPAVFTLPFLQTMGAKPRRLDDKTLTVTYTPNINIALASGPQFLGQAKPNYSPWINTHYLDGSTTPVLTMDATPHHGFVFWIQQLQATLGQQVAPCTLEVTAHFEFKNAWDKTALTPPSEGAAAKKVI